MRVGSFDQVKVGRLTSSRNVDACQFTFDPEEKTRKTSKKYTTRSKVEPPCISLDFHNFGEFY